MCVCVYYRIDTPGSHVGMYAFPYIHTEFILCLYIYVLTHRVYMCVCLYTCICTECLHLGTYIFAYMHTEFGW